MKKKSIIIIITFLLMLTLLLIVKYEVFNFLKTNNYSQKLTEEPKQIKLSKSITITETRFEETEELYLIYITAKNTTKENITPLQQEVNLLDNNGEILYTFTALQMEIIPAEQEIRSVTEIKKSEHDLSSLTTIQYKNINK